MSVKSLINIFEEKATDELDHPRFMKRSQSLGAPLKAKCFRTNLNKSQTNILDDKEATSCDDELQNQLQIICSITDRIKEYERSLEGSNFTSLQNKIIALLFEISLIDSEGNEDIKGEKKRTLQNIQSLYMRLTEKISDTGNGDENNNGSTTTLKQDTGKRKTFENVNKGEANRKPLNRAHSVAGYKPIEVTKRNLQKRPAKKAKYVENPAEHSSSSEEADAKRYTPSVCSLKERYEALVHKNKIQPRVTVEKTATKFALSWNNQQPGQMPRMQISPLSILAEGNRIGNQPDESNSSSSENDNTHADSLELEGLQEFQAEQVSTLKDIFENQTQVNNENNHCVKPIAPAKSQRTVVTRAREQLSKDERPDQVSEKSTSRPVERMPSVLKLRRLFEKATNQCESQTKPHQAEKRDKLSPTKTDKNEHLKNWFERNGNKESSINQNFSGHSESDSSTITCRSTEELAVNTPPKMEEDIDEVAAKQSAGEITNEQTNQEIEENCNCVFDNETNQLVGIKYINTHSEESDALLNPQPAFQLGDPLTVSIDESTLEAFDSLTPQENLDNEFDQIYNEQLSDSSTEDSPSTEEATIEIDTNTMALIPEIVISDEGNIENWSNGFNSLLDLAKAVQRTETFKSAELPSEHIESQEDEVMRNSSDIPNGNGGEGSEPVVLDFNTDT